MTEETIIKVQPSAPANPLPALYAALAKAQGAFLPIVKNREVEITMKTGGRYKFRYADLEEIIAKTRAALSANGLAMIQLVQGGTLTCKLLHADGGELSSEVQLPTARDLGDPKAFGAAISYLRRYLVTAMLGVAADDDLDEDGQEAGATSAAHQEPGVKMPQRREAPARIEPRAETRTTTNPAENAARRATAQKSAQSGDPADVLFCTAGEINWLQAKLDAAGLDWEQAHDNAGAEYVPGAPLAKAVFNAIKATL